MPEICQDNKSLIKVLQHYTLQLYAEIQSQILLSQTAGGCSRLTVNARMNQVHYPHTMPQSDPATIARAKPPCITLAG